MRKDLRDTEIGKIFDTWSEIEYQGYKSITKETDYLSLLRQKINNLYTRYFDKEVILKPDYMNLLKTPKRLYLDWVSGAEMSADELTSVIDDVIAASIQLKETYRKQKMNVSWKEYQIITEKFLQKCFDNCKLMDNYAGNAPAIGCYDFFAEDNFYVRYFCRCLEGYFMDFQKQYYGIKRKRNAQYIRCVRCGALIEKTGNRRKYCKNCAKEMKRISPHPGK